MDWNENTTLNNKNTWLLTAVKCLIIYFAKIRAFLIPKAQKPLTY